VVAKPLYSNEQTPDIQKPRLHQSCKPLKIEIQDAPDHPFNQAALGSYLPDDGQAS
jgi:hypothetical protein